MALPTYCGILNGEISKLIFDQMSAPVPEIVDGSLYVALKTLWYDD
jgi:hypothetical protein